MGYPPATMELPLHLMLSACHWLGRDKQDGERRCDLLNNTYKPRQSRQAHNIKTFYRFLRASIFWREGHFQWVVIATVRGPWLAGRWRVWGRLQIEGNSFDHPHISACYLLSRLQSVSPVFLRVSVRVWLVWDKRDEASKPFNTQRVGQNM